MPRPRLSEAKTANIIDPAGKLSWTKAVLAETPVGLGTIFRRIEALVLEHGSSLRDPDQP
jgi:hypothetical protein